MNQVLRTKPISRLEDAAVPTTGTAFAIPNPPATRVIRVNSSADAYVGLGNVLSPIPAASETNTVHHETGTENYYLDGVPALDGAYLYVYSQSATVAIDVSFLG